MNVVLDTNVYVSAAMSPAGAPAELIRRWRSGTFQIIVSTPIDDELADVLARPEAAPFIRETAAWIEELANDLADVARRVAPGPLAVVDDDPDDDLILATAVAGGADYIVTGDKHLLVLRQFRGIRIVTPRQFLSILKGGTPESDSSP